MRFSDLVILLPCTSLEDLSLDRDPADAEGLLSAYSALWHPALLASAQAIPQAVRAEDPPQEPAHHLVMVPAAAESMLPPEWIDRASSAGACVIHGLRRRADMVAAALEQLDGGDRGVDPDLAADFLALGYGHLLVELLTRQLRYMSNLDEVRLRNEAVAGAEAALAGDAQTARERLRNALDQLSESREYFYPVEAYLLDLILVAPTTLGAALREELAAEGPTNLLLDGSTLERMAAEEPETLAALREALEKDAAGLIGGGLDEAPLPLLPVEALLEHLRRGFSVFDRLLGRRPGVFGRRRFGLTPVLPQLVHDLGMEGVFHCTLDDGRFPSGNQSKVRWEGLDGTEVEALGRVPIDVARPDSFLSLPNKLGDTLDLDHTATAVMARWPGQTSPWLEDLRRMVRHSPVVGKFVTVDHYFEETRLSGQQKRYGPDEYRAPYLRQEVAAHEADPISRWVRYYARRAALDAAATLSCMADMATGRPSDPAALDALRDAIAPGPGPESASEEALEASLREAVRDGAARVAAALPREPGAEKSGVLLANPSGFARRVWHTSGAWSEAPARGGPIRAVATAGREVRIEVEVPPTGFVWVGPGQRFDAPHAETRAGRGWLRSIVPGSRKKAEDPPLAEEGLLRNESFEVKLNPTTGAIHSVHDYRVRGSRLAQQLVMRIPRRGPREDAPEEGPDTDYSIMAADAIRVLSSGPLVGEVEVRGRLMDREGVRVAGFVEWLRVRRGSPILEIEVELDPDREPEANPWDSYYGLRFAWGDQTAQMSRSVNQCTCRTETARLEAPLMLDLEGEKTRTTFLTGGLPYHRRFGVNKLDTLLVVRGETARRFRLGVGFDLQHPASAAAELMAPPVVHEERAPPPTMPQGWLLHVGARHVALTAWEPIAREGVLCGFRARLLETEGRAAKTAVRCFRDLREARRVDFTGKTVIELPVERDRVTVNLGPYQFIEIEAQFAD